MGWHEFTFILLFTSYQFWFHLKVIVRIVSCVSASEAFFDNLTVEQEFMTGVDTDKVFSLLSSHLYSIMLYTIQSVSKQRHRETGKWFSDALVNRYYSAEVSDVYLEMSLREEGKLFSSKTNNNVHQSFINLQYSSQFWFHFFQSIKSINKRNIFALIIVRTEKNEVEKSTYGFLNILNLEIWEKK